MIIKSITHSSQHASAQNLINYFFRDSTHLTNPQGESLTMNHLLHGDSETWNEQFKRVEQRRKSFYAGKEVKLYHEILSFNPKSKPTIAELRDLVNYYVSIRTDTPTLSFATAHFEDNVHVHICFSGLDMYGKSIRLSKREFNLRQQRLEQYQETQYPHLSDSLINYSQGSKKRSKLESHPSMKRKIRTGKKSQKELLYEKINMVFLSSPSVEAFIAELAKRSFQIYYVRGVLKGVVYKGRKWRFSRTLGLDFTKLLKPSLRNQRLERLRKMMEEQEKDNDLNLER